MSSASRLGRLAARWHARTHADYLVLGYIESLERSTAVAREEMSAVKYERFTPSGRYVAGRLMAWTLLLVLVGTVAVWWSHGGGAEEFRAGWAKGRADAMSAAAASRN